MATTQKSAHELVQKGLLGINSALVAVVAFLAISTFRDFKEAVNTVNNLHGVPSAIDRMQVQLSSQDVHLGIIDTRLGYIEKNQQK